MLWERELDEKINEYLPDLKIAVDEPMRRHTSFHIGGPVRRMAFPASAEQAVLLLSFARECGIVPLILGNGTNLLVTDGPLDRLAINMSQNLTGLECRKGKTLCAEAGVSLARLAVFAQKRSLTGFEFAHGIPGTLGGAICMNAGAYGGEMKQIVRSVTVLDPETGVHRLSGDEMKFGYRRSVLTDHPDWAVLSAEIALETGNAADIQRRMEDLMQRRRASQPLEYPSAGSTFKRPEGYYAGTLIDQCGLKGLSVGGAQVSEKHAGFIINRGDAAFDDVLNLIQKVQSIVFREKGVHLEPEVKIIR